MWCENCFSTIKKKNTLFFFQRNIFKTILEFSFSFDELRLFYSFYCYAIYIIHRRDKNFEIFTFQADNKQSELCLNAF